MRIHFTLVVFLSCLFSSTFAQDLKYCGTTEKEKELIANNPSILVYQKQLNEFVKDWIQNHKSDTREETIYIIPLVFHIIHDYGTENITDEQVKDAVRILNLDYRKMNADTSAIVSTFKNIATDAKIEFRLANKAPDGSCTSGIEHIHSLSTNAGGDNAKLSDWPRSDYLNIWTVNFLEDDVAGYAYLPVDVNFNVDAPVDGVIILADYVGSIGSGSATTSRSLTHEIGHTLGLLHPWGNNNFPGLDCGDDEISDTPVTAGWTSCNLNGSVCTPGVIENVQNYMEYSYCSNMFTTDQGLSMQAALNNSMAQRNNLWTNENLISTGTDDTIRTACAPIADFYPTYRMGCTGNGILFHDISSNGSVTTRSWTFQDGTPSTSSEKDPQISFSTLGWKSVTLTVSNGQGSSSMTQTNCVYVSAAGSGHPVGFFENFEDPNSFSNDWIVFNPEDNTSEFLRVTNVGYNSSSSVKLINFKNMDGDRDQLISPSYDLSSGGIIFLNFRYSCASSTNQSENVDDGLYIYSSTDCGKTWLLRTTISKTTLANVGNVNTSFTPTSSGQWIGKSVLLPSSLDEPNVRFKFEYKTNGKGNNFYIDDINVSNYPVGIDDPDASSFSLNIFPNPVTQNSSIVLNQQVSATVTLRIVDIQGRIISLLNNGWLSEGEHHFDLSESTLKAGGIYMIVADDGITVHQQKFVFE